MLPPTEVIVKDALLTWATRHADEHPQFVEGCPLCADEHPIVVAPGIQRLDVKPHPHRIVVVALLEVMQVGLIKDAHNIAAMRLLDTDGVVQVRVLGDGCGKEQSKAEALFTTEFDPYFEPEA